MHSNSALLFQKYARPLFKDSMRVLEIAPDGAPSSYQKMAGNGTLQWETLDIDATGFIPPEALSRLTYVIRDEYHFPIPDNTFDIVVSGQVIEHVKKIWRWMNELARVCKPGGRVITINPVSWEYHACPVDCWRIYPEGMRALHSDAGLNTELAVFESLEEREKPSPLYLLRQALKPLIGKRPFIKPEWLQVTDTISVGVKPGV
jgi:SAM-dependent methyltransferase